jgi:hypothetical protein
LDSDSKSVHDFTNRSSKIEIKINEHENMIGAEDVRIIHDVEQTQVKIIL